MTKNNIKPNNYTQNVTNDDSPLKHFANAKIKITSIFQNLINHFSQTQAFFTDCQIIGKLGLPPCHHEFQDFKSRVDAIQKILKRDKMKVVFFGRTSNGKSSVVNCMLHSELVPANIGHTTSCFIQIEGTDSKTAKLLFYDIEEDYSLKRVQQLSTDISTNKLSPDSLMRLLVPEGERGLLKEDVVLVDSPGVDVTPDLDSCIDLHCMDADVFVLVENALATLCQAEKNFFIKVSSRLSKPNIFVLYNHWDASAGLSEEDYSTVKEQHVQRSLTFLVDELQVTDKKTAQKRIFFISAKETLDSRMNRPFGEPRGLAERLAEFEQFELVFQDCISNSAIHTKFEQHACFGRNVLNEGLQLVTSASSQANDVRNTLALKSDETLTKLETFRKNFHKILDTSRQKISKLVESAEIIISQAFKAEIKRLSYLLNEYDGHFAIQSDIIDNYKHGLNEFVETAVRLSMAARCASLDEEVRDSMDFIIDSMLGLIPQSEGDRLRRLIPMSRFVLNYRVECKTLCSGFREDIEFHFSLHPSHLLRLNASSLMIEGSRMSLYRNLAISATLISSAALKDIGWKALTILGSAYCLLYLFEKLTWTTKARERALKQQYASYASSKLSSVVDLTSSSCGHQIKQELTGLVDRLQHAVSEYDNTLTEQLEQVNCDLETLDMAVVEMQKCRHRSAAVAKEFDDFFSSVLEPK